MCQRVAAEGCVEVSREEGVPITRLTQTQKPQRTRQSTRRRSLERWMLLFPSLGAARL